MTNKKPFIFNPDEEPKDLLIATFVVREKIFEKIFKQIKNAPTNAAPQHFLVIGQRGMGKTTLLLRLRYAIEDDKDLSKTTLPVRLTEEQYQINSLPELWEEVAIYLENMNDVFAGMNAEMILQDKQEDYERTAFDLLTNKLKQADKKVVLFIDNIGDLLHKFTDQENHRLREILMTSPFIQLVGASAEMLEYTFHYDKPFFEFFYQLKLEPLNKEEAINLMNALAKNYNVEDKITAIIEKSPHRIEILRRLTGGVPRTMVLLFEIFIDYNDGSAFEDLEHLVDKVLPLYKARMDSLKPQQQKIIDAMARAWDPISSAEILEQSRLYRDKLTTNQISSQLKQMEENQLVETVTTGKRKNLYRIRERFFNIWYLMRNGRKQNREQMLWLIRFLESWCTIEDLKDLAQKQIDGMSCSKYSEKAAYYKAIALHHIGIIDDDTKEDLLKRTEAYLIKTNQHIWAATIHTLAESYNTENYLKKAYKAYKLGDLKKAEEIQLLALAKKEPEAENDLGLFYSQILNNYDKAEEFFLKAIKKGNVEAIFNFANFLKDALKDFKKSEMYYLMAIEKGDKRSMFNLANLYRFDLFDFNKAEFFYLKAIFNGYDIALNNLASLYNIEKKDINKAINYYLQAIDKGIFVSVLNLFNIYWNSKMYEIALNLCKEIFQNEEWFEKESEGILQLLIHLHLKKQYHFILDEYKKENSLLAKYMQPIYYVIAWYLKDEMPGEYEKAGSEIKESIDEIIKTVDEMQKAELITPKTFSMSNVP